ncbi:MAG TPA: hypothetical protein PLA08_01145 [Candidatus Cloacimonadota bacterium]|nr:hypothetical protein [Candidatus Cloacimonadota bacterium]
MGKYKLAILKNEDPFDHEPWIQACENRREEVEYQVIDLTQHDWFERIDSFRPSLCLLKPSGKTELFRTLYQERVDVIVHALNLPVFPSYIEIKIYENKKFFAYWAVAENVPHPQTWVFYNPMEALEFSRYTRLPIVGKKNIGASGKGVKIIRSGADLERYIRIAFTEGIASRTGPRLEKGRLLARLVRKLSHPRELANRLSTYKAIAGDRQKGYLILQEFINHDFEWRVVRIGDSFFAHKKLKDGDKASGTLLKDYGNPPLELLDFVYDLTETHDFHSVAVDLFEHGSSYLVNEIQCIFGQSDPFQMMVDGRIGRYVRKSSVWVFEEGGFAKNACYDLRLDWVLTKLKNRAPEFYPTAD